MNKNRRISTGGGYPIGVLRGSSRSVACPTCGVSAGARCRGMNARTRGKNVAFHLSRRAAAQEAR